MATDVWQSASVHAAAERRRARRSLLVGRIGIEAGSDGPIATVLDLSIYGCRLQIPGWHDEGDRLWLRFDGGWPIAATVMWSDGGRIGCRFDEAISRVLMRELHRTLL
ncbi:PilZ domain-containing protein [Sphingomonas sp.]|uniref:PilZ domain-containing protein n=1 Tax=Sphingomonas sp. TaxID=28214 RepID=UPI003CC572DD